MRLTYIITVLFFLSSCGQTRQTTDQRSDDQQEVQASAGLQVGDGGSTSEDTHFCPADVQAYEEYYNLSSTDIAETQGELFRCAFMALWTAAAWAGAPAPVGAGTNVTGVCANYSGTAGILGGALSQLANTGDMTTAELTSLLNTLIQAMAKAIADEVQSGKCFNAARKIAGLSNLITTLIQCGFAIAHGIEDLYKLSYDACELADAATAVAVTTPENCSVQQYHSAVFSSGSWGEPSDGDVTIDWLISECRELSNSFPHSSTACDSCCAGLGSDSGYRVNTFGSHYRFRGECSQAYTNCQRLCEADRNSDRTTLESLLD